MKELFVHFRYTVIVFSPDFAYDRRVRVVGRQLNGSRVVSTMWIGIPNTSPVILALVCTEQIYLAEE